MRTPFLSKRGNAEYEWQVAVGRTRGAGFSVCNNTIKREWRITLRQSALPATG